MPTQSSQVHGKCLLVGGYAVLFENVSGVIIQAPDYFQANITSLPSTDDSCYRVRVSTPQFPSDNVYLLRFDSHRLTQPSGNKFIDSAMLVVFGFLARSHIPLQGVSISVHQTAGFINKRYVLTDDNGTVTFSDSIKNVEKTGLGSSACLIVCLVEAALRYFLSSQGYTALQLKKLVNVLSQSANNLVSSSNPGPEQGWVRLRHLLRCVWQPVVLQTASLIFRDGDGSDRPK